MPRPISRLYLPSMPRGESHSPDASNLVAAPQLRKFVELDSFGACAHNNDTCAKSGKHKCDKVVKVRPATEPRRSSPPAALHPQLSI